MNVSKPRPDDHPALFLFVIGGITFSEIRQIRNIIKQLRPSSKVCTHMKTKIYCIDFSAAPEYKVFLEQD